MPAGIVHAYRVEEHHTRVLGVSTGGFERFFQTLGEPTEATRYPDTPLGQPPRERFLDAGQRFDTTFLPPSARLDP